MKKRLYYVMPFVVLAIITQLSSYMDRIDLINMNRYIWMAQLLIVSIVRGNITPTNKKFDYLMTFVVPLSYFCICFMLGFLDRGEFGTPAFSVNDGFETAFQSFFVIRYCVMAVVTFLASFKPIRITRLIKVGSKNK